MAREYEGYELLDESQQQIRLMTIHPASDSSDTEAVVTCTLETIALRNANPFYALSYAWGPATPMCSISVNGQTVHVRRSLWLFLQTLRARFCHKTQSGSFVGSPIRVWADYVCIQQSNTEERSYQVSMMGDVYKTADAIYAWLGEAATSLNDGMQCVAETVAMREQNMPWIQILKQVGDIEARIRSIATSPYWNRMWIKQEALLAKDLWFFYGADVANWQDMLFVAKLCPKARVDRRVHGFGRDSRTATNGAMLALLDSRDSQLVQSELWVLMQRFVDAQCLDARDRVYALLSLIDQDTRQQIVVDYSKPVFQVLLENYVHWTQHDPTRPSKTTAGSDSPIWQLGSFCANLNKMLTEADFEVLCSSEDIRREVTTRGVFAATNISSIDWTCAIATIGVTTLDPVSRKPEVDNEESALVLKISLRPYRSRNATQSRQCFIYSGVMPSENALVVWIGSRVLFLRPSPDSTGGSAQGLDSMYVVGTGTEIRERSLKNGEDDRLRTQFLLHPSLWLTQQLPDARFEIVQTERRISTDDIPVMCNAAAMASLLREYGGDRTVPTQSNSGGRVSHEEIRSSTIAGGQPLLWSPYLFGFEHKLLQPCRACRSSAVLPKWQENVLRKSSCECKWNQCIEY